MYNDGLDDTNSQEEPFKKKDIDLKIEENEFKEVRTNKIKRIGLILAIVSLVIIIILVGLAVFFLFKGKSKKIKPKYDPFISNLTIYIEPKEKHTHSIIFLGGLANKPQRIKEWIKDIDFPYKNSTRIIIPGAPKVHVDCLNWTTYSWFNIYSFPVNSSELYNYTDITISYYTVKYYLDKEAELLGGYDKIFLGGYSQGSIMSIYTAFTYGKKLNGLFMFDGFLPEETIIPGNMTTLNIFMTHGGQDEKISIEYHNKTIEKILNFPFLEITYYEELNHTIHKKQFKDWKNFIARTIK